MTTPKQLIVIDTKAKKRLEAIDLTGGLQAIDIAPDFSFVAVAPSSAQFIYKIPTKWQKQDDMEISQIRFDAPADESGVFGLAVGSDNSIVFSMSYAGSGWVALRRIDGKTNGVQVIQRVRGGSVVNASADRKFAAIAEGDISSGPLLVHDFAGKTTKLLKDLGGFNYEIACSRDAAYFARPGPAGCQLYDDKGGGVGNLQGKTVIAAAFHPKDDRLFIMRQGELGIQEYDMRGRLASGEYMLDRPLAVKAEVNSTIIGNLFPVGRDTVMAQFRRVVNVVHRTYASGRLRVSDDGEHLFAVLPNGVYMFPITARTAEDVKSAPKGPKIKVVDSSKVEGTNVDVAVIPGKGELRVAKIDVDSKSLLPCSRWADPSGSHVYLVDGAKGDIVKAAFPSGKIVATKELGRSVGWLDQSAEGWLVSVPDREEVWILNPKLETIKTIPVPKLQRAASSPRLSIAAVSSSAKGPARILDLKTGELKDVQGLPKLFGGVGFPVVSPDGQFAFFNNVYGFTRYEIKKDSMTPLDSFKAGSNFREVTVSPDSKLVCQTSGGGNPGLERTYRTAVMAVDSLKSEFVLDFGPYPGTIGFDTAGGYIYAQAIDKPLIVADKNGVKLFDHRFRKTLDGGGFTELRLTTVQFLPHPAGKKLLMLSREQAAFIEVP
ncbi:MAG: hypothetical protein WCL32_09615 [Planctomycetota bacterium]